MCSMQNAQQTLTVGSSSPSNKLLQFVKERDGELSSRCWEGMKKAHVTHLFASSFHIYPVISTSTAAMMEAK